MTSKPVILVVDDDAPIVGLMRSILKEFGFETATALTGPIALESARERRPDLVLVDKNMPGMSGEEVIRAMRTDLNLQSPILILSGEPVGPAELQQLGANGAVLKPFDVLELVERIRSELKRA